MMDLSGLDFSTLRLHIAEWGKKVPEACTAAPRTWPKVARKAATSSIERTMARYPGSKIVRGGWEAEPVPQGTHLYRWVVIEEPAKQ